MPKTNLRTVFFTIVGDNIYDAIGTPKMINSFRLFHPDIDLVVFRDDEIIPTFQKKNINFYMAKPTFAKKLTPYYDLVVNVDADHVFLGRCEEILKGDYDIGCPINKNDYENTSVENVTEDMFLQGGMVASTKQEFWDKWEERNKVAMQYKCKENDIMNLVIYNDLKHLKLKIFDKDKDYYGCKSLNREGEFYIKDSKVMCRKEQVFIYHHAKGGRMPKLVYEQMGFTQEVIDFMNKVSNSATSTKYTPIFEQSSIEGYQNKLAWMNIGNKAAYVQLGIITKLLKEFPHDKLIGLEVGSAYGGGVEVCAKAWKGRGKFYGYDTFEGHPKDLARTDIEDGIKAMDNWYRKYGTKRLSYEYQRSILDEQGLDNAILVKGRVNEHSFDDIPFAHYVFLDMDIIAPMRVAYQALKDKIVFGGYLLFHDSLPANHLPEINKFVYNEVIKDERWKVIYESDDSNLTILQRIL